MNERSVKHADIEVAEYVLGTLDDVATARIERALDADSELRQRVAFWETRLGALGLVLTPVEPPAAAWANIEAELAEPAAAAKSDAAVVDSGERRRAGTGIWKGIAVAASLAAIVLAALLFNASAVFAPSGSVSSPAYASMLYDQRTGMSWLVTVAPNSREMHVVAMGDYAVPRGKTLRAWIKPADGSAMFVGQLPHKHGDYSMKVSGRVARALGEHAQLMISMDDVSQPASAGPNGPIKWKAPVARRTS